MNPKKLKPGFQAGRLISFYKFCLNKIEDHKINNVSQQRLDTINHDLIDIYQQIFRSRY